ncbi:hypothetical protein IGI04_039809, partial [Brassica rapa subsp. trilocularis]
ISSAFLYSSFSSIVSSHTCYYLLNPLFDTLHLWRRRKISSNSIFVISFLGWIINKSVILVFICKKKRKSDDKLEDFMMDINKMAATKRNSAVRSCSDVVVTTTM